MIDLNSQLQGVADREKWAARGASFVAKVQATKAVWFPPKPVESGKKAASAAKKTTKRATKKTAGAAKATTKGTKKATTRGTKKVTNPVRQKKT